MNNRGFKVATYQELLYELQQMTPEQLNEEIMFVDREKDRYTMGMTVHTQSDEFEGVYFELKHVEILANAWKLKK